MTRERTDKKPTALLLDTAQARNALQIDQRVRAGEALLHGRDQRLAAREQAGFVSIREQVDGFRKRRRAVIGKGIHGDISLLYSAAWRVAAIWIVCQIRLGEAGMSMWLMP